MSEPYIHHIGTYVFGLLHVKGLAQGLWYAH